MCGEHPIQTDASTGIAGSSPHVRGALGALLAVQLDVGIIPACAGSTDAQARAVEAARGSSPHVRGALKYDEGAGRPQGIIPACAGSTKLLYTQIPSTTGSSPHVRGALDSHGLRPLVGGIIPACAGSTKSTAALRVAPWDHPRMCGEHGKSAAHCSVRLGSSPHVRGARP